MNHGRRLKSIIDGYCCHAWRFFLTLVFSAWHSRLVNNLLDTPTFTVSGARRPMLTLPGILSELGSGTRIEFDALQPHQQHGWYAFLVYLAAYALDFVERDDPEGSEEHWYELLMEIVGNVISPWCLRWDHKAPAFLQPPDTDRSLDSWEVNECPDDIDILVTAKNHDVKMSKMINARPEHWVYALVMQQTMQGFHGRGHYGISKMNGGFGNRPYFSLVSGFDVASRFRRDVKALLGDKRRLLKEYGYSKNGVGLLWLKPWDGKASFSIKELHPFHIEIGHRIRLGESRSGRWFARRKISSVSRIENKNGNTGDFWTPRWEKDGSAVTITDKGFTYDVIVRLLVDGILPPSCVRQDGEMWLCMQTTTRGQGKTEGFHNRVIEIPCEFSLGLQNEKSKLEFREKLLDRVRLVNLFVKQILKPSLLCIAQSAPEELRFKDTSSDSWIDEFYNEVDDRFFREFFSVLSQPIEDGSDSWSLVLLEVAEKILKKAMDLMPTHRARRYAAIAAAERVFYGAVCNNLPEHFQQTLRQDELDSKPVSPMTEVVNRLVWLIAYNRSQRDLAALKQMPLEGEQLQAFIDLQPPLDVWNAEAERRWALIVRSFAELSRGGVPMHRLRVPLGRALSSAGVPEDLLLMLLRSRGRDLSRWTLSVVRRVALHATSFDYVELAELILSDGCFEIEEDGLSRHERIRRRIAKHFYLTPKA